MNKLVELHDFSLFSVFLTKKHADYATHVGEVQNIFFHFCGMITHKNSETLVI